MYGNEKNPSRMFEIYKRLFELKEGDRSVLKFYDELKGLFDMLEMHQPAVTDAETLRGYRQDLAVSKFLSDLSLTLRSQVRGQILKEDSIPTFTATFSRVMQISTRSDVSSAPSIEQSAMTFSRGRGRGRSHNFGGRGREFVGGERESASWKGPRQCRQCKRSSHISEKC